MSHYKNRIDCVRRYHQQTKHRFERYAKGPETLDWSMQPDPFRRYNGAAQTQLPFSGQSSEVSYVDLYEPGKLAPQTINLNSISALLELSMGLSAWKEYHGDRWALRCNPSSGNLHPTETYVVISGATDVPAGVYHYVSYDHVLEQRCAFADSNSNDEPVLLIGLSSVLWREAWKYGERAFRYCQLDVGHAIAAIRYACALNGWSTEIITSISDDSVSQLLGINRDQDYDNAEREHADVLLKVNISGSKTSNVDVERLIVLSQQGRWAGSANVLDKRHLYDWPIIEEVAQATKTDNQADNVLPPPERAPENIPLPLPCNTTLTAKQIIQRRRSAQNYDGLTGMEAKDFYRILDMVVPRQNIPPWDTLPWPPRIHLVLFVHRVNGLEPGLYIMLRNAQAYESFKGVLLDKLEWSTIDDAPEHLQLYRLVKANSQKAAATLSCHQRIASDSAFSLGMLSEFDNALQTGPWSYKNLYWEAGMLGQVLYLEAEAVDLQGTGIGCFFDDPFHEMLGIKGSQYQSLYHFTVGGALNDARLRTLMPYEHLKRD